MSPMTPKVKAWLLSVVLSAAWAGAAAAPARMARTANVARVDLTNTKYSLDGGAFRQAQREPAGSRCLHRLLDTEERRWAWWLPAHECPVTLDGGLFPCQRRSGHLKVRARNHTALKSTVSGYEARYATRNSSNGLAL